MPELLYNKESKYGTWEVSYDYDKDCVVLMYWLMTAIRRRNRSCATAQNSRNCEDSSRA